MVQANPLHTIAYFEEQWIRQREMQLKAINVKAKEKRDRLTVLLQLEEELLEARQVLIYLLNLFKYIGMKKTYSAITLCRTKLEALNAQTALIRTAEHRQQLLDLPRSLAILEDKVQGVTEELGHSELLNARLGSGQSLSRWGEKV